MNKIWELALDWSVYPQFNSNSYIKLASLCIESQVTKRNLRDIVYNAVKMNELAECGVAARFWMDLRHCGN